MAEICGDNRFELIEKYKTKLIEATNIETAKDEMAVIDNILFRFWQMGWLDKLEADVVPKSAVEKIFEEIDKIVHGYRVDKLLAELGVHIVKRGESTLEQRIAELKNKYLATDTNDGCKYTESEGEHGRDSNIQPSS